jgi:hypothetical protein
VSGVQIEPDQYVAGLQCKLRLWRAVHEGGPAAAEPTTVGEQAELWAAWQARFPTAVRVEERDFETARTRTDALLAAPERRPLLGAALAARGARARPALLEPLEGGWGIRDLQCVPRVRDPERDRAALLAYLLRETGQACQSVELWQPDPAYERRGALDPRALFQCVDLTADARFLADDVARDLEQLAPIARRPRPPDVAPGPHCTRPTRCPHRARCTEPHAADWLGFLPRLQPSLYHDLRERGIERIAQVPETQRLGPEQRNARLAARAASRRHLSDQLGRALRGLTPPLHFLDCESASPALPLFEGTRPFQALPVQWSLHTLLPAGQIRHASFLCEASGDPRPAFAQSLAGALASQPPGAIAVYSGFEDEVLRDLAQAVPGHAKALEAIRSRLVDLLPVVRSHVYDLGFRGQFTLKRVAPALAPGTDYEDLEISEGAAAARTWLELLRDECEEPARARGALEDYCARDTLALLGVWRALNGA